MEYLSDDFSRGWVVEVRIEGIEAEEGIPAVSLLRRSTRWPWY